MWFPKILKIMRFKQIFVSKEFIKISKSLNEMGSTDGINGWDQWTYMRSMDIWDQWIESMDRING